MLSKITSWRHSKVLAFVLAVAVFLTAFYGLTPVISFAEGEASQGANTQTEEPAIWDGTKAATLAAAFGEQANEENIGTEGNPYEITTGAQLYAATTTETSGIYFKLMKDIQLQSNENMEYLEALISDGTALPEGVTLNNWARSPIEFKGCFDGNFHTVSGLYYKAGNVTDAGFINKAQNATIKNITFDKMYVEGGYRVGGVVAYLRGTSTIDGCSVINSSIVNSCTANNDGQAATSAIVGTIPTGTQTIRNCSVFNTTLAQTGGITDTGKIGAIWGDGWVANKATISNCVVENLPVYSRGTSYLTSYTNVYTTASGSVAAADGSKPAVLTEAQLKSGAELPGLDATTGWELKDGEYPKYTGKIGTHPENTKVYWNGYATNVATSFADQIAAGVDGTEGNEYKIYYGHQLYAAVSSGNAYEGKYFVLMNDVQLQTEANMLEIKKAINNESADLSTLNQWRYVAYNADTRFAANLDGNFKTVSGMYQSHTGTAKSSTGLGFISVAKGGSSISNLTLDAAYLTGTDNIGGFIGMAYTGSGGFNISGCVLKNSKLHSTYATDSTAQFSTVAGFIGGYWSGGGTNISNSVVHDVVLTSDKGTTGGFYASDVTSNASNAHTLTNCISVGYVPQYTSTATCSNVYTTATYDRTGVTDGLTEAQLKGVNLPTINPTTGWVIAENEYPKYVGEIDHSEESTVYWDGYKGFTDFTLLEGEGTEAEPYKIHYPYELYAALNTNAVLYFELQNDIYLQSEDNMAELQKLIDGDTSVDTSVFNNWAQTTRTTFCGTLDGNGHTIYGVYGASALSSGNGFIARAGGSATVKNLTLNTLYFEASHALGGIIGLVYNTGVPTGVSAGTVTVFGCTLENASLKNTSAAGVARQYAAVGAIFGGRWSATAKAENCVVKDNVTLTNNDSNYKACLSVDGNASATNCIFAIPELVYCKDYNMTCTNVYSCGTQSATGVTANMAVADLKGVKLATINPTTGWVIAENEYPKYVGEIDHPENTTVVWDGFNGFKDVTLLDGEGTVDKPYKIYYPYELFAALQNSAEGKYFEIMNDFDLNNIPWRLWHVMTKSDLATQKAFSGTLNGNGHTIYNYYEPTEQGTYDNYGAKGLGLIPAATNATVKDLHVCNAQTTSWSQTAYGVFVGLAKENVVIDRCSVIGANLTISNQEGAGFIGEVATSATISNSVFAKGTLKMVGSNAKAIASFVGNATGTVTLENVVANGYGFTGRGEGIVNKSNASAIGTDLDFANVAAFKAAIADGTVTLDTSVFYGDALSDNVPLLKNRIATQNKDIDGDGDADLDADDAIALKNILLYGYTDYLTLSVDNANGYNDLEGVDITDLVALYN